MCIHPASLKRVTSIAYSRWEAECFECGSALLSPGKQSAGPVQHMETLRGKKKNKPVSICISSGGAFTMLTGPLESRAPCSGVGKDGFPTDMLPRQLPARLGAPGSQHRAAPCTCSVLHSAREHQGTQVLISVFNKLFKTTGNSTYKNKGYEGQHFFFSFSSHRGNQK